MMLHLAGLAASFTSASMLAKDRFRLDRERIQRTKDSAPCGPEVSRQVRRKLERQRMKKGSR
jgi:hypothetical protein